MVDRLLREALHYLTLPHPNLTLVIFATHLAAIFPCVPAYVNHAAWDSPHSNSFSNSAHPKSNVWS